jgi:hypothetical protein
MAGSSSIYNTISKVTVDGQLHFCSTKTRKKDEEGLSGEWRFSEAGGRTWRPFLSRPLFAAFLDPTLHRTAASQQQ